MVITKKLTGWLLFLSAMIAVLLLVSQDSQAATAMQNESEEERAAFNLTDTQISNNNCRYGASGSTEAFAWADTIGVGWASNYLVEEQNLASASYMPIIRVSGKQDYTSYIITPSLRTIGLLADRYPGRIWQVGNEPDVSGQDNMTPELYAQAYHDVYIAIKDADPTAQVANAPLAMVTPSRLQYLDIMWESYKDMYGVEMPVDVWSAHIYLLAEGDTNYAIGTDSRLAIKNPTNNDISQCAQDDIMCRAEHDDADQFEEQLITLRQWLKEHGQQEKALVISEWSILYPYTIDNPGTPQESCFLADENGECFTPDRVNAYMNATIDAMDKTDAALGNPHDNNRLVQQYMWFSYHVGPEFIWGGGASSLLTVDYETKPPGDANALTEIGRNYSNNVAAKPQTVNLHILDAVAAGAVATDGGTATATLRASFTNNGDYNIQTPFKVGFYRNAAMTQLIGEATFTPIAMGCGVHEYVATVDWENLSQGWHNFWVKLDAGNTVAETNESNSDNTTMGRVFVGGYPIYSPLIVSGR